MMMMIIVDKNILFLSTCFLLIANPKKNVAILIVGNKSCKEIIIVDFFRMFDFDSAIKSQLKSSSGIVLSIKSFFILFF